MMPDPIEIRPLPYGGLVRQRWSRTADAHVDYLCGVTTRTLPATEYLPERQEETVTTTSPAVAVVGPDLVRTRGGTVYRLIGASVAELRHVEAPL